MFHSLRYAKPITNRRTDKHPYPITKIDFLPISLIGMKETNTPIKFAIAVINAPKPGEIGNYPFVSSFNKIKSCVMYTLTAFIPVRFIRALIRVQVHVALLYFLPNITSQIPSSVS